MDIRTKLVFALVAVSLGSMFVFGALISPRVEADLRRGTLEELDLLAESKKDALLWIVSGWQDRVDLVAGRTALGAGLQEYGRTGSAAAVARIVTILTDARDASESVTLLRVYDIEGRPVASVTRGSEAVPAASEASFAPSFTDETVYAGVELVDSGPPRVSFTAPVTVDDRPVGMLLAVFEARELLELTGHYEGLGDTGETLIVEKDAAGVPRTLHPTRHASGDGVTMVLPGGSGSLAARALGDEPGVEWEGVSDYRGQRVWAATRYVPETGWGLVVKVDELEQIRPYLDFTEWLRKTALVLSAFAILGGFGLGLRFALPIHDLAEVANRIRKGEMHARVKVIREDEVGVLARTFNEMASEIEQQMSLLAEFQKFFDVSIDMMCIAGTDGYFKRTNPAFERELGWSEEELLSRPFYDLVHPDDLGRTEREVAKLAQGIPTISFENRFLCADGSYKLLRWTSYPDEETGMLYAIAHVMEDRHTE